MDLFTIYLESRSFGLYITWYFSETWEVVNNEKKRKTFNQNLLQITNILSL